MQRSARQRSAAILLAVLAQGSLLALYVVPRAARSPRQAEGPGLVFVQPLDEPALAPPPDKTTRTPVEADRAPATPISPAVQTIEPVIESEIDAPRAITLPPPATAPIDWHQVMEDTLRDRSATSEKEERERGNPLDSKPDVLQLPKSSNTPPPVTAQRLDNGELVTRHRIRDVEVVCVHRPIPLAEHFEAGARARAALCNTHTIRTGLEGMEKLKPGYISRPPPKPRPAAANPQ